MSRLEKLKAYAARRASDEAREGGPKVSCACAGDVLGGMFSGQPFSSEKGEVMSRALLSLAAPALLPVLIDSLKEEQEIARDLYAALDAVTMGRPVEAEAAMIRWRAAHPVELEEE